MLKLWLITLTAALGLANGAIAQTNYQPPRTAQGHPDFQGNWKSPWLTPLERPAGTASLVLTPAEARTLWEALWKSRDERDPLGPLESVDVRSLVIVDGKARSSLIVDPADGKLPLAEAGRARRSQSPLANGFDGPEHRPLTERCIVNANTVAPMLVHPAGNIRQIVQTADHLMVLTESFTQLRVVPIRDQAIAIAGAGHGHWEGDTLVVETAGYAAEDRVRASSYANFPISPATRITERFTRTSENEILYTFTVEDASLYLRPWRAEMALARSDDRVFEWACHEGNYAMTNMLRGGRRMDTKK